MPGEFWISLSLAISVIFGVSVIGAVINGVSIISGMKYGFLLVAGVASLFILFRWFSGKDSDRNSIVVVYSTKNAVERAKKRFRR